MQSGGGEESERKGAEGGWREEARTRGERLCTRDAAAGCWVGGSQKSGWISPPPYPVRPHCFFFLFFFSFLNSQQHHYLFEFGQEGAGELEAVCNSTTHRLDRSAGEALRLCFCFWQLKHFSRELYKEKTIGQAFLHIRQLLQLNSRTAWSMLWLHRSRTALRFRRDEAAAALSSEARKRSLTRRLKGEMS